MDKKIIYAFISLIFLTAFVSAEDISLVYPSNGDACITGQYVNFQYLPNQSNTHYCSLFSNMSGTWSMINFANSVTPQAYNYFNLSISPGSILWGVYCTNVTNDFYSVNYTFTVVKAPYCAILSETSCTGNISINTDGVVKTRLSNSRGFYLENADWIYPEWLFEEPNCQLEFDFE